jgi:hypothetical protein
MQRFVRGCQGDLAERTCPWFDGCESVSDAVDAVFGVANTAKVSDYVLDVFLFRNGIF